MARHCLCQGLSNAYQASGATTGGLSIRWNNQLFLVNNLDSTLTNVQEAPCQLCSAGILNLYQESTNFK